LVPNDNLIYNTSWFLMNPSVNFTNILRAALTLKDPESVKNTVKSSVSFYAFGTCGRKSCTQNVDEIEPWYNEQLWPVQSYSL